MTAPRTAAGRAFSNWLLENYGQGDSQEEWDRFRAEIAAIEAEAAAAAHRKYLDIAATNGEIGLLLVETQTVLAAVVAALDQQRGIDDRVTNGLRIALAEARRLVDK